MEIREDEGTGKLTGHAAVFNEIADLRFFRERISPGAFRESIKTDDVRALFNHDSNFVLGRNTAGTLSMKEDKQGLAVEITPPDTQWARDLKESIRRGDISQMSFGFEVRKEEWDEEQELRTLNEVKLWDVSPVTFAAYEGTDIALRNREAIKKENYTNGNWTANVRGKRLSLLKRKHNVTGGKLNG